MFTVQNFRLFENNQPVRFVQSPNVDVSLQERRFVVMHYTGGAGFEASVAWLASRKSGVSAHLVIGRNGEVVQPVSFNLRAWHAGTSAWRGYSGLNNYSIGIELDNAGIMKRSGGRWVSSFGQAYPDSEVLAAPHKSAPNVIYGWHKYTDLQLQTAARVVAALVRAYGIEEIIGHDDIAPGAQMGPGAGLPDGAVPSAGGGTGAGARQRPCRRRQSPAECGAAPGPAISTLPGDQPGKRPDGGIHLERALCAGGAPACAIRLPSSGQAADLRQNDCGAASAIMVLRAYFPRPANDAERVLHPLQHPRPRPIH